MPQAKPDIPGYRVLRQLGHGGMSEIWLAEQIALARPVAIKVVSLGQEADSRLARFRQEASLIARFDHPNVVGIIEFGDTGDGRLYFSMPYVPNGTLAQASLNGDVPRVREVLVQILDALAYIHQHGVVHRDVKPENVLFDSVGRARLADFGVSRSMAGVSRHTRAGETFGSSLYMSPEQARGDTLDGRSDLYSLGAVAYELLTGSPPFRGPDDLSIAVAHLQSPVPRLPDELRHWQGWFDSAMAKRPEQRFADAQAMRGAMDRIPDAALARTWFTRLRAPVVAGSLITAIMLLIAAAVWTFTDGGRNASVPNAGDAAEVEPARATGPAAGTVSGENPANDGDNGGPEAVSVVKAAPGDLPIPGDTGSNDGLRVDVAESVEDTPPVAAPTVAQIPPSGVPAPAGDSGPATNTAAPSASPSRAPRAPASPASREAATNRPSRPATLSPEPAPAPAAISGFASVPGVPLFLLAGSRDEQLRRIDDYLDAGRRLIETDRTRVEQLRRDTDDRDERKRLRDDYDARKSNYETWRRQVLELRKKAARLD